MKRRNISFSSLYSVLFIVAIIAYLFSAKAKSWVIMGFMLIGFFKPDIPEAKPGDRLPEAPALIIQDTGGKTIDLQQQKGKVVFINFWATWCPPCLAELPAINNLYLRLKSNPNIVFLTIDVDNNLPVSSRFMQKNNYLLPVYSGVLDGLPTQLYSGSIPTTLVIDKKGFVVFNHINRANYDDEKFTQYLVGLSKQ